MYNHVKRYFIRVSYQLTLLALLLAHSVQAQDYTKNKPDAQFLRLDSTYSVRTIIPPKGDRVKNVILMIGDGMSLTHVYSAWVANRGQLWLDNVQVVGLSKTYCANRLITDSGAGGTAMACGQKTNYHMVATDTAGRAIPSIVDLAQEHGLATGVVVTCRLTDATPATFCCSNPDREKSYEIAEDYLKCGADFIFGGGAEYFEKRPDQRNLFTEMQAQGYATPRDWESLAKIERGKVFSAVASRDLDVPAKRGNILADATEKAIELLSQNEKGFFLMVEGSQIDDYGHFNDLNLLMQEVLDFDYAIGRVLEWAAEDGETLVVITADHQTGGLTLVDGNLKSGEIVGKFSSSGHTGIMVPVYAFGPMSILFTGIYENSDIFHRIVKALELKSMKK